MIRYRIVSVNNTYYVQKKDRWWKPWVFCRRLWCNKEFEPVSILEVFPSREYAQYWIDEQLEMANG